MGNFSPAGNFHICRLSSETKAGKLCYWLSAVYHIVSNQSTAMCGVECSEMWPLQDRNLYLYCICKSIKCIDIVCVRNMLRNIPQMNAELCIKCQSIFSKCWRRKCVSFFYCKLFNCYAFWWQMVCFCDDSITLMQLHAIYVK